MGTGDEFSTLETDLGRVHEEVLRVLPVGDSGIDEAALYLARQRGKYFRPALAVTSAYLVAGGPASAQVITAAAAVEVLHLATLHHDDLCDGSAERRGIPAAHVRFGSSAALVVGDLLLATALGHISVLGTTATKVLAGCARQICAGQFKEIEEAGRPGRTIDSYLSCVSGKTAELLSCSALLGATAAGASVQQGKVLALYGYELGMAFQIWNDVRNLRQPPGTCRTDLSNRVHTLPVLYGLQRAEQTLRPLLNDPDHPQAAVEVARVLEDTGALASALADANTHLNRALSEIGGLEGISAATVGTLLETLRRLLPEASDLTDPVQGVPAQAVPGGPRGSEEPGAPGAEEGDR